MNTTEKPPSIFSSFFKKTLSSLLPSPRSESKDDVLENLRLAEQDGIVARDAYDMMQRVMRVSDLKVRDIMIPRSSMVSVERDVSLDECLDVMVESAHSRFPVVDNEKDQIVGILLAKDLLKYFDEHHQQRFNLHDLTRPVVFVPESKRLNVLLSEFRENRNYEESMIRELDNGETMVKALLPIDEFNEHFEVYLSESGSDTIGGLVSQTLGHIPQPGETVEIDAVELEVVHGDNRRIHLLKVKKKK